MTKIISQAETKNTGHCNLSARALLNVALARGEGSLARNGAFSITTALRAVCSPRDLFIVQAGPELI